MSGKAYLAITFFLLLLPVAWAQDTKSPEQVLQEMEQLNERLGQYQTEGPTRIDELESDLAAASLRVTVLEAELEEAKAALVECKAIQD